MNRSMTTLMVVGALLVLLGLTGLAIPYFTTDQTTNVAQIGDLKLQAREETPHNIPPPISEGAVVLGVILIAGGFYRGRRS